MCAARGIATLATVADHVIPHRWNYKLFWEGELQSLCKPCHDRHKQRAEVRGYSNTLGEDGWPADPAHPHNRKSTQRDTT